MRFSRWLVPATVATVVAGGGVVSSAAAGDAPDVPDRTPAQVLALVAGSRVEAFSGTVRTAADLGLPALPALSGGAGAGSDGGATGSAADPQAVLTRLLTGRTTIRVWADGPQRQRVQLLDRFAEVALIRNGRDAWAYDTGAARGTRWVLPDAAASRAAVPPDAALSTATPQALAEQVLDRIDPTTSVTLAAARTVAGRAAYTLVVTPRTDRTLVDRAVLAVDARTGMPLQVQVYGRGRAEPVLQSGFSTFDPTRPAAARFRFTPPAGAEISTEVVPAPKAAAERAGQGSTKASTKDSTQGPTKGPTRPDAARPDGDLTVVGSGWSAILVATPDAAGSTVTPDAGALLANPLVAEATTAVPGGRALRTALFSVLLADDGRVLVGAVPVDALVAAAR